MATAPAALAAMSAPAGNDYNSAVDAAFDKLGSTTETSEAPVEETVDAPVEDAAPEAPAEDAAPEPEQPAEEKPAQAEPNPPEEDEWQDGDPIEPVKVTDGGKTLHFKAKAAHAMLAARETWDKVQEVIPGATPEAIKQYYDDAVAAQTLVADFDSGDPAGIEKFSNFFFGPQSNPQSVQIFADSFFQRLPQVAPQIYDHFLQQAEQQNTHRLYEQAIRTGDESLLALAQNRDYAARGAFMTKEDFKRSDPQAEERQRFEQRVQQFNAQQEQARQQAIQQRTDAINRDVDALKTSTIEKGLAPVKAQYENTPHWKFLKTELLGKVEEAIAANPTWRRQFDLLKRQAVQDTSGKAAEGLKAMMETFATRVVNSNRKGLIDSLTGTVLSANKTAHQQAAQAAARREPAGNAAPAPRVSHAQKVREAKTYDDAFEIAISRR